MIRTAILGFPRIGRGRELKRLVENYWKGQIDSSALESGASGLRESHRKLQAEAGISDIPSGDFTFYDHVLDLAQSLSAIPDLSAHGELSPLDEYFLLARGKTPNGKTGRALEMTKWFDTNYHYIVPEIHAGTKLQLRFNKARKAFQEALAAGVRTRPVLVGPVSFLLLSKNPEAGGAAPLTRLADLLPLYAQILRELTEAGADWVQIDEPCLAQALSAEAQTAYKEAYAYLAQQGGGAKLLLTTYFASIEHHLPLIRELPVSGLHVDLVAAPGQLEAVDRTWPNDRVLSLGVIEGRNIWRGDLAPLVERLAPLVGRRGKENLIVSTSCSLLHCPFDLEDEKKLDPELKSWLAFSVQKLSEVSLVARALDEGIGAVRAALEASSTAQSARKNSQRVHRPEVTQRLAQITKGDLNRAQPYPERARAQREALGLPELPTTTIGSFPQTEEIRKTRAQYKSGAISEAEYLRFIDDEIRDVIERQEALDLDVLVHGEPERNDMVEYFASQLEGFLETEQGWVQSYGSRCVKPPVIYGDVVRPRAMTVREAQVAQAATKRHVKGMLTGPVTMLKWSFVRNDQPLSQTAQQLALALRDEVSDLEAAGIAIIQVDEPALREGLPLLDQEKPAYLRWAADAFRLSTASARPETQIHTHMCYSEFSEILQTIIDLDADVISIEASRSRGELFDDFVESPYPNEIGPGVYDIHSPRIPETREMVEVLRHAARVVPRERLWVNPDCGLKTRSWSEVTPALANMVAAARHVRSELG